MTEYRPLPSPPERPDGQPAFYRGAELLAWLLANDCTATVATADLELAEHAALVAVASRDIAAPALERINGCRLMIAAAIKTRAELDSEASPEPAPIAAPQAPQAPSNGNGGPGHGARLIPPQPTRPSPGDAIQAPRPIAPARPQSFSF